MGQKVEEKYVVIKAFKDYNNMIHPVGESYVMTKTFKTLLIVALLGCCMAASSLNDEKYKNVVERIASRIGDLKHNYKHFSNYKPKDSNYGHAIIYRNGVREVPNPQYVKLTKKQEELQRKNPSVKRQMIPETVQVYSEIDGIDLRIDFFDSEQRQGSARAFVPHTTIGDLSIEVTVNGANTRIIGEIQDAIYKIIDEEKSRFEKKHPLK